jgi:hypothetical protein
VRVRAGETVSLALIVLGVAGLSLEAGSSAGANLHLDSGNVEVKWMSGVTYNGRACVGMQGLHGDNAYDLIADDLEPCWDHGVPADVSLRTLAYSPTAHLTLRGTISSGSYPAPSYCDYIEVDTIQDPSGEYRGKYRYVHATGTPGQLVDIWAGPAVEDTDIRIGSTSYDSDCQTQGGGVGWTGYHTHQDSGGLTYPASEPNPGLPTDDDIPLWDPSSWIHKWTYPAPVLVPSPPASVTLSGSAGSGTVIWGTVSGAAYYQVYVSKWNNGGNTPVINWAEHSSSPYSFLYSLSDDYHAAAKACNAYGCSDPRDSSPYWVALGPRVTMLALFGPSPTPLSDSGGTYMWVMSSVKNPEAVGQNVVMRLGVPSAPSGCSKIEQRVLPGVDQFWLDAGQEKWVLYRVRWECHAAQPRDYATPVDLCIRRQDQPSDAHCRSQTRHLIVRS